MFRVITCNTNGIRAAQRKGFFEWLAKQNADVVCIQETKAQEHQLVDDAFRPEGFHCYYNDAEKKGYSGTALYAKQEPSGIQTKVGWEPVDSEGRYLRADFEGLSVISLYVPSGSSNDAAQARKDLFMEKFTPHMKALLEEDREFIICADWNTCHQNIDIKKLAQQSEKFRFHASRAGVAYTSLREAGLGGYLSANDNRTGPLYLVVQPRTGVGQQYGMAPRLHACDTRIVG